MRRTAWNPSSSMWPNMVGFTINASPYRDPRTCVDILNPAAQSKICGRQRRDWMRLTAHKERHKNLHLVRINHLKSRRWVGVVGKITFKRFSRCKRSPRHTKSRNRLYRKIKSELDWSSNSRRGSLTSHAAAFMWPTPLEHVSAAERLGAGDPPLLRY